MSSPLRRGALIAGGSALALFAFMFFDWFADGGQAAEDAQRAREVAQELGLDARDEGTFAAVDGWSGLGWLQVVFVIAAISSAIVFAVVTFTEAAVSPPVALSAIVTAVGLVKFLALFYSVINPPGAETDREIGLFLGLLATAGIVGGGYLGMQEEPRGASPY